ncbi:SusC/RagA family TonB-linked outer membrane protein [Sphingobacterium spiritivorum]|uniref:SusC/RagA family TonB-linked outer membrane protein n=1 Tax=Sphingobacterium spiritivorum TaxID=258 RepID=UPI00191A5D4F|nr:SusC/RagA family TonB-linked outer membrane protein [Sphingobacterium spiritivorum]QQT27341.1 SusC/RagA family TonB-linked outer membrane protein [Sphingobacterium spiritivorum]
MKQKLLSFILVCTLMLGVTYAQNRQVSGKITSSEDGSPISGASVSVVGASRAVQSDGSGNYSISVPANATLSFSYVGFTSQRISVGNQSVINVVLSSDAAVLDEVVVTAMGQEKSKRALGYATQNVKGDQLLDKGDNNILNALQGKVAGVEITGASGAAGASTNIVLRGISSLTGNNQPLFVVDGIPISNDLDQSTNTLYGNQPANRALDLDPNNIASLNILQGPAAAALYGTRASAGAIIITTKKGSGTKGKTDISFNTAYGVQNAYGFPKLQNKYGQGASGVFNAISGNSLGLPFGTIPTLANGLIVAPGTEVVVNGVTYKEGQTVPYVNYPNNFDAFFEQGHTTDNNLSILSGDAKSNLGFSLGKSTNKGILPNSNFDKVNARFSAGSQITDQLNISGSINYFNTTQIGATTQGNGANSSMFAIYGVTRSTDLEYYKENYTNPDGSNNWFIAGRDNPFFASYENTYKSKLQRFMGNVDISYDITNWLNATYRVGLDSYNDRRKKYITIGSTQAPSSAGSILEDSFYRTEFNGDLILTAKKQNIFTEGLNLTALVGQSINQRDYQNLYVNATGLTIPDYTNVANGQNFASSGELTRKRRVLGVYGQLSFAYKNYLFLDVTGRADKSSTLPKDNNTYFYPSVSSSFVFSDLMDLEDSFFSFGKVRAAYARVGRDANEYVLDPRTFNSATFGNNTAQFNFPYGPILGFGTSTTIGNDKLKPEFTESLEAGLNVSFLKNRLSLDVTVYKQGSKNQIISVGLPTSTGYSSRLANVAEVSNKGIELLLNGTPVKNTSFQWDVSANFSKNRNKVESLADGIESFAIAGNAFGGQIPSVAKGYPFGVIMGSKYQRSPDGDLLVDPATGLYFTNLVANQVIADPNREWSAGLTNNFRYKKFFLSALVDFKKGGDMISWTTAALRSNGSLEVTGEDRDKPHVLPGVIQNPDGSYSPNNIQIPAQTYWNAGFGGIGGSEFNVFDATTFRLREVSIGYDIDGKTFGTNVIKNVRIVLYGRNLYYYAPNSLIDPELSTQGAGNIRGMELQSAPNTRNFGGSLRVTF